MNRLRCAIYTRKSSEEGLEQEFNSLHAQREACEAFIKSQKHEGWQLIKTAYDDGGISGGTMQRPALQQLLSDIVERKIDIIVVYKVDRLTRSLADFARMVELFDKHQVSFVSVTQQFNTTTSMGRLTLNVLLSFAQFEREVTGERIRDKVAASKKKGMWMGGTVLLGYMLKDKKLLPHPAEVEIVRQVFEHYQVAGCVRLLKQQLERNGVRSRGGFLLSRGMLYNMLSNPMYIGKIRHKDNIYDGQHEAIIPQALWEQVQAKLTENRNGIKSKNTKTDASLLADKLFDVSGEKLITVHANKKGRRYRYYVSKSLTTTTKNNATSGWRLPAHEIERMVGEAAVTILKERNIFINAVKETSVPAATWTTASYTLQALEPNDAIGKFLQRVELCSDGICLTLSLDSLFPHHHTPVTIIHTVPMQIKRRGIEMRLIIPSQDSVSKIDDTLVRIIARAHKWFDELMIGKVKNLNALAAREETDPGEITRILKLAFLSPKIVESILVGKQPVDLTRQKLLRGIEVPYVWDAQAHALGFAKNTYR